MKAGEEWTEDFRKRTVLHLFTHSYFCMMGKCFLGQMGFLTAVPRVATVVPPYDRSVSSSEVISSSKMTSGRPELTGGESGRQCCCM